MPADSRTNDFEAVFGPGRRWRISTPAAPSTFVGQLRQHELAGATLVSITGTQSVGQLPTARRGGPSDELYLALQLNLSGRERIQSPDAHWDEEMRPGDMILWRTDQRHSFEVLEPMQNVSLMIPWQLMREHLPQRREPPAMCRIESHSGIGLLLAQHLLGLAREVGSVKPTAHATLCRTSIELLDIALPGLERASKFNAKAVLRERVRAYIAGHLHEDDLSPARIAAAHGVSLRYLQALFAGGDATVAGHILESRLARCWQALTDPACQHLQVSDIAFRWGFKSASHFCHVFKQRYQLTPGEMRRMAAR
ncbi:helix-turn-helix domain-containing protein [Cupriavidus sp. USMAA2-4]|uniref:helix-turn-helix domain-containing protein n=1 Tax=Cupriavidus sp. USMAA2-4 TaxID=876364 RepID=UPI001E4ECFB1|nr:helix-turn-helix domain-containing protein [Cupriavidus sp. USMAA2-4]